MRTPFAKSLRKPTVVIGNVVLSGLLVVLTSCGGPVSKKPSVNSNVNNTIGELSQEAADAAAFSRQFVEGATVPEADREKYTGYSFYAYSMDVSGNSATASVTVRDMDGNEIGIVDWTLELVGEDWKLKTAPLP